MELTGMTNKKKQNFPKPAEESRTQPAGSFHRRLAAYSLAAGMGMVAADPSTEAAVVYSDIADIVFSGDMFVDIDINAADGFDFRFARYIGASQEYGFIKGLAYNEIVGGIPNGGFLPQPDALANGDPIGGTNNFIDYGFLAFSGDPNYGNWAGQTTKYLGLKFDIGGNTHYGWAGIGVDPNNANFILRDFAYEDVAGIGITAGAGGAAAGLVPEPSTFGMGLLAMGAAGIRAWRKRRQQDDKTNRE